MAGSRHHIRPPLAAPHRGRVIPLRQEGPRAVARTEALPVSESKLLRFELSR